MKIVIDCDCDGDYIVARHILDTDGISVTHPTDPSATHTVIEHLHLLHTNPELREQCGWNVVNQLPDDSAPMSRWERLCAAANHPTADVKVKALKLSVEKPSKK